MQISTQPYFSTYPRRSPEASSHNLVRGVPGGPQSSPRALHTPHRFFQGSVVTQGVSSSSTDGEIIALVLSGRREAFALLVRRHQDRVFSMIMKQTADGDLAKELTQESFIRCYRFLSRYEGRSAFSTWLTRIAINVVNSYLTSPVARERRSSVTLASPEFDQSSSWRKLPEESREVSEAPYIKERLLTEVQIGLRQLPPHYRDTVVLFYLERKSYQEIAEILEIPMGTVASRLSKAIQLLQAVLKGRGE